MRFLIKPDLTVTQKIWNILETKEFSTAMKVVLPYIKFCKKFYFKRTKYPITIEEINNLTNFINNENNLDNKLIINNMINENNNNKNNIQFEGIYDNKIIPKEIEINNENNKIINELYLEKFPSKELKKENREKYIKVKVLHNSNLYLINDQPSFLDYLNCCSLKNKNNETRNSIIIHIHGGGFVAMSPSSHEGYTRKWSKILEIPVFSIDYRLSPQFAFPNALDDVYQVYNWIIEYAEEIFNIKLNNIILVGDSAGGNLCLALTYILIIKKIRLPNVIFLAYPALKLSINPLSLSYLNSLTDPILECSLLIFCLKSYCGDMKDQKNPFLSPLYMKDDIIKLLPPIRIYGGTSDPLRDDYVEFMNRCVKCNIDCKMEEYMFFPHGFLNYDFPMMLPEASIIIEKIAKEMEKYII
jgi:hormone-sensitive lipase